MSEALIEVRDVVVAFGGVNALDGVSLSVGRGEILSIIGPNGAGKTTLFNVISGNVRPTSGSVHVAGRDVTGWPQFRIARLGVGRTNQIVRPFARLSVLDNVAVGALVPHRSLRSARAAAAEIVEFVGLRSLMQRDAGTLTLTQRKRLEIARALALEPQVMLARRSDGRLDAVRNGRHGGVHPQFARSRYCGGCRHRTRHALGDAHLRTGSSCSITAR